jgi:two-component system chemotaxis sensor kinase CheA
MLGQGNRPDLDGEAIYAELAGDFQLDAQERVARVEDLLLEASRADTETCQALLSRTRREVHTLKGNAGMMGRSDIQNLAHQLEDEIDLLPVEKPDIASLLRGLDHLRGIIEQSSSAASEQEKTAAGPGEQALDSIRVPFADLDALVDVLAEMVIFRNRLHDAVVNGPLLENQEQAWEEVEDAQEALGTTLKVLQGRIMGLRMVPLSTLFIRLKRIVHDVSVAEDKEIQLELSGGETPMDKALLEVASETLGHIIRNAAIHGIEPAAEREAIGKPSQGRLQLTAVILGNDVVMEVRDDGRGINADRLLAEADSRGISSSGVDDPYSLLFRAGMSTRDDVDLESGRGYGLSAAESAVRRMGGRIDVTSQLQQGTSFRITLPLSVSITRALLVEADQEVYALPVANIEETRWLQPGDVHEVNHAIVHSSQDQVIPVLDLGHTFATATNHQERKFVVLIETGGKRRGLLVDAMKGIREIVVKGLDSMVGSPAGISGSTILGDGRVVLILDPNELISVSAFLPAVEEAEP